MAKLTTTQIDILKRLANGECISRRVAQLGVTFYDEQHKPINSRTYFKLRSEHLIDVHQEKRGWNGYDVMSITDKGRAAIAVNSKPATVDPMTALQKAYEKAMMGVGMLVSSQDYAAVSEYVKALEAKIASLHD